MPKIQEYVPEVTGPAPVRATPGGSIDAINPVARGLEQTGNSLEDVGVAVEHRQTQDEIADTASQNAGMFVDKNAELADGVQKGNLDVDAFKQKMNDDYQTIGDQLQTPGARRYFEKQSALMQRHLMSKAVAGAAEIAGAKAQHDYVTTLNTRANNQLQNPEDLPVALASHEADLNELVNPSGGGPGMSFEAAQRLGDQGREHIVKATIEGVMRANPNMLDQAPNQAKAMLDSGTAFGQSINSMLSEATTKSLYNEIESTKTKNRSAKALLDQQTQDAIDAKNDRTVRQDIIPKAVAGTITPSDIEQALPGDAKLQEHWIDKSYEWSKRKELGSPQDEMEMRSRIFMDPSQPGSINNLAQLENASKGRDISGERYSSLVHLLEKDTVKGRALNTARADYDKLARTLIRPDPVTGAVDPKGAIQYRQAIEYSELKEAEYQKAGKNILDLYDTSKPNDYIGGKVETLKRPFTQVMQEQAEAMKKSFNQNAGEDFVRMSDPDGKVWKVKNTPEAIKKYQDKNWQKVKQGG